MPGVNGRKVIAITTPLHATAVNGRGFSHVIRAQRRVGNSHQRRRCSAVHLAARDYEAASKGAAAPMLGPIGASPRACAEVGDTSESH